MLSQDEIDALDIVSAPDMVYPYWHQYRNAHRRFGAPDLVLRGPKRSSAP